MILLGLVRPNGMTVWYRLYVRDAKGTVTARETIEGQGAPNVQTVDEVARRALEEARAGRRLVLVDVTPALRELIELAALPVEVER
jgi:hypothetical protein